MGRGEEANSIYVGGLKFSTDSDGLQDYFSCYGKVLGAKVRGAQ
jgi:RNA recognition motif-containing protein